MIKVSIKNSQPVNVETITENRVGVKTSGQVVLKKNGGVDFTVGDNMLLENGVLYVKTTDDLSDSRLPITAYGVQKTVGNIEVLLKGI